MNFRKLLLPVEVRMEALVCLLFVLITSCGSEEGDHQQLQLWYDEPAAEWTEALPIGNGRVGGMVFGRPGRERIQFNEETLWTGQPRDYSREGAVEYLDEIRALLFAGKQAEAEELAGRYFMGKRSNERNYNPQKEAWLEKIRRPEFLEPARFDFDDSGWDKLQVPSENGWERVGLEAIDGALWFRFSFDSPDEWLGKALVLELGRIRDLDYTYFNGKLVGTTNGRRRDRVYEIPATSLRKGKNTIAVQIINFQNKGGFVGLDDFDVPMMIYPRGGDREKGIALNKPWKYREQDIMPPVFPEYTEAYQPFGDIWLEFEGHDSVQNYRRTLDISNAISRTTYSVGGVSYEREYFVSAPDQVLVVHLAASEKGKLNFRAKLSSKHRRSSVEVVDDRTLELTAPVLKGALRGVSYLKAVNAGGEVSAEEDFLTVKNADEVTLYLTAATNFKRYDDVSGNPEALASRDMAALADRSYAAIRNDHVKDYRRYFDTFSIDLGETENAGLPTDERIKKFASSKDPSLVALYVQYGRYLMISSSRPGTMPPNLQGIWNDLLTPPWGSKYTTNINLEMNYWPAEVLNLSELHEPLFTLIEEVAEQGKETAREHYGADGWVLHHNTDLWRATAPVNASNHGIWVTGGAWLCHHLWEHFLFTQDTAFLRERAYPLMKGAAEFFTDFLIEDPETGWLISTPSNSPETGGLVAGPTMDHQLIRALFQHCAKASELLGVDASFRDTLRELAGRIAPNQIGKHGQLQEWLADIDDPENHHRHVSHLWGVFPGREINVETPELLEAAKQSLIFRGDEGTGWSLAWKINLWARFRDGNHAHELIRILLSPAWGERDSRGGSYVNLFDAHPPFQIDGNFGAAAGIAEMLVQSQGGKIVLLPALPDAWPAGSIRGLKARGGFELNMSWKNGALESVEVISASGQPCNLEYRGQEMTLDTEKGESYRLGGDLKQL